MIDYINIVTAFGQRYVCRGAKDLGVFMANFKRIKKSTDVTIGHGKMSIHEFLRLRSTEDSKIMFKEN